jgi:succinate dehydrogenase / fumarate reductase, cytochrome b subunit
MATSKRPLSPFMIGPYYRPQLTSVLSIIHRGTGVFLVLGAVLLVAMLMAAAAGPEAFAVATRCAYSLPGKALALATVAALAYHFFNGIRHLLWDIGWGYELPRTYVTGYLVIALTLVSTLAIALLALRAGGAA